MVVPVFRGSSEEIPERPSESRVSHPHWLALPIGHRLAWIRSTGEFSRQLPVRAVASSVRGTTSTYKWVQWHGHNLHVAGSYTRGW